MRVAIGQTIRLTAPLPVRCCDYIAPAGSVVTIGKNKFAVPDAKRIRIARIYTDGHGIHHVKASKIQGVIDEPEIDGETGV